MNESRPPYLPNIHGGKPRMVRDIGGYRLVLLGDLESPGPIQYLYVLAAFRAGAEIPCLCVASEKNMLAHAQGSSGSHFLGVFPGEGHLNLGASDDWAHLEKFAARALEICREHLGLPEVEARQPPARKPWWRFWWRFRSANRLPREPRPQRVACPR